MEYAAYIIISFTLVQLIITLVNLLFPEKIEAESISNDKMLSILVPARNESTHIKSCLESLISQDYKNIEILVGNDQSEDNTADLVQEMMLKDARISLLQIPSVPDGWIGKPHACAVLAAKARGDFLLFMDADVRIRKNIVSDCVAHMLRHELALISLFPHQELQSNGEKKTVPIVYYILLSLLPLRLVRTSSFPSLAAANGQFMLFNKHVYNELHPHEKMKMSLVEDIDISRHMKKKGKRISVMLADKRVSCRMYQSFKESVNGFGKNVCSFFGNSFLIGLLFWLITGFGFILVYFGMGFWEALLVLSMNIITRLLSYKISGQSISNLAIFMLHQQMALGAFLRVYLISRYSGNYRWKNRTINFNAVK